MAHHSGALRASSDGLGQHSLWRRRRFGEALNRLAVAACLLVVAFSVSGCGPYVLDIDLAQQRLDMATPPLDGSCTALQSFVCQRPNLCQIELLPAVYEGPSAGMLTLCLEDTAAPGPREVARWSVSAAQVRHNTPLFFSFPPQRESSGRGYILRLEGTPDVHIGIWYNSVDAYGDGSLELGDASTSGDMYFITRCQYDLATMMRGIGLELTQGAGLALPLVMLLLLPGFALRQGLGIACDGDPVAGLALSLGISLALVPVGLLWSTLVGLHWGRTLCRVTSGCIAVWVLLALIRTRCRSLGCWFDRRNRWLVLAALGLLALTLLVRLVQVRDLALPAWVDSPQHALVTQLVATHGQVPRSYEPFVPVGDFVYHFGFHADAALLCWLSTLPIPQAMLVLGQVLNVAAALGAYLLAVCLTRRKIAALAALLIVGVVSYMPAYYVSWGRYTQLAGMVILPPALVISLEWLQAERRDARLLVLAAVLQAGLFMTHARVSIYGACFIAGFWLCEGVASWVARRRNRAYELSLRLAALLLVALALSAPWLLQVVRGILTSLKAAGATSLAVDPGYNAFPTELLFVPRNAGLMALAALGAVSGLLRCRKVALWTLIWLAVTALLLNPGWAGLGATGLVNNATAVIALFLPLSVLGGEAWTFVWDSATALAARIKGPSGGVFWATRAVLVVSMVGVALWGAWGMLSIVNPTTVLATQEDVQAMEWIREHTAVDALFLTNARAWQLGIYVGTDGGYWIPQLTGRKALLPALSYAQGTPEYVRRIAELSQLTSEVRDADDPALRSMLEREGVTHVYIGAKGGTLTPQMFLHSSGYQPVYCSGQVWIFEVRHN